jgi:hypothetical protein
MRPSAQQLILICLLSAYMAPQTALGDAIMVSKAMTASTVAEIFVEANGIRVEMEVGVADLEAFANLLPDAVWEDLGKEPRPLAERIEAFLEKDWVISHEDGQALSGRLVQMVPRKRIRRDEITGEPLPVQPAAAENVLFVELAYTWSSRPDSLAILPPMGEDGRTPAANIGFVLYHGGVPVNDFRYLAAESTVDLDWDDPWYSRFRHRNLKRQYDAPLSVFLYVESFEIRKEIVVRPKDLQQWVDVGLQAKETISVESQEALKQQVADFLSERSPVTVDGQPVQGTLDRIHFIRRSLRTTGVVDPPEDLDVNTATLGVIFVYPIDGLPQEASLTWDLFGPRIQNVPAAATDEAGGMPSVLSAEDPELRWQNLLTNPTVPAMMSVLSPEEPKISVPVISGLLFGLVLLLLPVGYHKARRGKDIPQGVVLAGAAALVLGVLTLPYARASLPSPLTKGPVLETQQAETVLHALLHNVYRAFDHRDESLVYDQLGLSISGDLLTDVYLQVRRSMELENQGGARVKVDEVDMLEIADEQQPSGSSLAFRCRWTAAGSVGHWGHIHRRTNQYDAVITIEPVEDVWKITAIDLREEQRVDPTAPK